MIIYMYMYMQVQMLYTCTYMYTIHVHIYYTMFITQCIYMYMYIAFYMYINYMYTTYRLRPIPMASVATMILQGSSWLLNSSACCTLVAGGRTGEDQARGMNEDNTHTHTHTHSLTHTHTHSLTLAHPAECKIQCTMGYLICALQRDYLKVSHHISQHKVYLSLTVFFYEF